MGECTFHVKHADSRRRVGLRGTRVFPIEGSGVGMERHGLSSHPAAAVMTSRVPTGASVGGCFTICWSWFPRHQAGHEFHHSEPVGPPCLMFDVKHARQRVIPGRPCRLMPEPNAVRRYSDIAPIAHSRCRHWRGCRPVCASIGADRVHVWPFWPSRVRW